jgi:DegV family protein with EDD domain
MPKYHILTDSSARFSNARVVQQYGITIAPNKIEIGTKTYREDVDLPTDELMKLIMSQSKPPKVTPPSVAELSDLYAQLAKTADGIISIHPSRDINDSWHNARTAAQQLSGTNCEIAVIDSRTLCAGQGMLVRLAGQSVQAQLDFESIVKLVRGAVERVYSVYFVETLEYLRQNAIMSESRGILGAMLGIKPFLSIEDGRLMVIEKVRTRSQATEQLVEFLGEFDELDDAMIVQARQHITEQTRTIQDRLSMEFVGRHFPFTMYGAMLASLIGTDATGVVVLEKEMETYSDDYDEED